MVPGSSSPMSYGSHSNVWHRLDAWLSLQTLSKDRSVAEYTYRQMLVPKCVPQKYPRNAPVRNPFPLGQAFPGGLQFFSVPLEKDSNMYRLSLLVLALVR